MSWSWRSRWPQTATFATPGTLISWRQSLRLFEAAGEPKELYVAEGAGHAEAYAVDPDRYRQVVLDFLERYLG